MTMTMLQPDARYFMNDYQLGHVVDQLLLDGECGGGLQLVLARLLQHVKVFYLQLEVVVFLPDAVLFLL